MWVSTKKRTSPLKKEENKMNEEQTNENKYFIKYADVETKQIDWLWFPYLPKGMVSII